MSTAERFVVFFFTWQFLAFSATAVLSTTVFAAISGMYQRPSKGFQTGILCGIAFGLGALAAFNTM